ncbi:MAG: PfkB family carbohydrate kinase [Bacteriovoracia bacterium]
MEKNSILTVGSLAFDSIETPAGKADGVLGGSGNYFSVASSFFSPVQVVGVVGEDFPKSHVEWLKGRGIDVSGIQFVPGKTFHWKGQYDKNLNEAKTLQTDLNVFADFNPKLNEAQKQSTHVFLANIDPVLQQSVLDQVRAPKLVACDTMNYWISSKLSDLKATLKRIDILSINEGEAYQLSGHKNLVRAAGMIRDMGPSTLVIKRGEYGAWLFTPNGTYMCPAYPVNEVVDPTGAGDSFAGAFMGYLAANNIDRTLSGKDAKAWDKHMRQAMVVGCVTASFTVEDFSLHRLMRLERQEIDARRESLLKMVQLA